MKITLIQSEARPPSLFKSKGFICVCNNENTEDLLTIANWRIFSPVLNLLNKYCYVEPQLLNPGRGYICKEIAGFVLMSIQVFERLGSFFLLLLRSYRNVYGDNTIQNPLQFLRTYTRKYILRTFSVELGKTAFDIFFLSKNMIDNECVVGCKFWWNVWWTPENDSWLGWRAWRPEGEALVPKGYANRQHARLWKSESSIYIGFEI